MIDNISKNVKLSSKKKKKLPVNELDNVHVPSQRNKDRKKDSGELPHTVSDKKKRKHSLGIDLDSTLENSELPSSIKKKNLDSTSTDSVKKKRHELSMESSKESVCHSIKMTPIKSDMAKSPLKKRSKNNTSKESVETVDATGDKSKKPLSIDKKGKMKQKKKSKSTEEEEEKPNVKETSLEYLRSWEKNRSNWKFQKVRQTWLLRHMYEDEMVPAEDFKIMLSYLEGLKGVSARDETQTKAKEIMEKSSEEDENSESYNRARNVLQIVS